MNYGPSIRGRSIARGAHSDSQTVNVVADDMDASALPVDDDGAIQSSPLHPVGPVNLTTSSGTYSATTRVTSSITIPGIPYSNGSNSTCTDYSSAPETTSLSSTISSWRLTTICSDTPTLCGTGPFPRTVHANKTKSPRMITPAPQTAHRERPQGFLFPPLPQVMATPLQTGYAGSTGAKPDYPIPFPTAPVRAAQKVPVAQHIAPTQDPQAAHWEHPALNLDIPRQGRVRRTLPSHDLTPEAFPAAKLDARVITLKPQPQTARAMATLGLGAGGPGLDGALDNGHPVAKLSNRGQLAAVVVDRLEDADEQVSIRDGDTGTSTASIWNSHANRVRGTADSSRVTLMATILSVVALVMVL